MEDNIPRGELQTLKSNESIQSQRLLPGLEDGELSLKQRLKKRFNSLDEPYFHYKVHYSDPARRPDPSTVQLEIMPLVDKTTVSLKYIPMKIQV